MTSKLWESDQKDGETKGRKGYFSRFVSQTHVSVDSPFPGIRVSSSSWYLPVPGRTSFSLKIFALYLERQRSKEPFKQVLCLNCLHFKIPTTPNCQQCIINFFSANQVAFLC